MRVQHIVGARPNFMKLAPVHRALAATGEVEQRVTHTGQHYDRNMSAVFFEELRMAEPDENLAVGWGSHAQQTVAAMVGLESSVSDYDPDLVLVYGDVNSTVAAALVCSKLLVPVGHVEAGLRSFDRTMPEEINRLLTDQIADLLFTPSEDGDANLAREGIDPAKVHFVGNVMIDTVAALLPDIEPEGTLDLLNVEPGRFGLVTLHRPSNVDDTGKLASAIEALSRIAESVPLVFPIHPRTRDRMTAAGIDAGSGLRLAEPLGYRDFLGLQSRAQFVVTDSGGIQEETTYLQVPCITMRKNTERPITVSVGTNTLVGDDLAQLADEVQAIIDGGGKRGSVPPLWDGSAAERIARVIVDS